MLLFSSVFAQEEEWTTDSCMSDYSTCMSEDPEFAIDTDPQKAMEEDPDLVFKDYPEKAIGAIENGDVELKGEVLESFENSISSNPSLINDNFEVKQKWLDTYGINDMGGKIMNYNSETGKIITSGAYSTTFNLNDDLKGARLNPDGSLEFGGGINVKGGQVSSVNGDYIVSSDNIIVQDGEGEFLAEPGSELNINGVGFQVTERTRVERGNGYTVFEGNNIEIYANGRKVGSASNYFKMYDNLDFDLGENSEYRDNTDYYKVSKMTQFRTNCGVSSLSCVENGENGIKIFAKGNNKIEYGTSLETSVFVEKITDGSSVEIKDGLMSNKKYVIDRNGARYSGGLINYNSKIDVIVSKGNNKYEVYSTIDDARDSFEVTGSFSSDELLKDVSNRNSEIYTSFSFNTGKALDSTRSQMPARMKEGCNSGSGGVCQVTDSEGKIQEYEIITSKGGKELFCRVSDDKCFDKNGYAMVKDETGFYRMDMGEKRNTNLQYSSSFRQEIGGLRDLNYNIGYVPNEYCGRYVGMLCEKNGIGCSRQDAWTWIYGSGNEQTYDSRTGQPIRNYDGLNFNDLERSGQLIPGESVLVFYNPTSNWKHKLSSSRCSSQGTGCGTHVALYVGDGKIAHQLGTSRYDETTSKGLDTVDRLLYNQNYRLTQVLN